MAEKQRIPIAFGSFAGFKLLYPAGPLIVATGLGVADPFIMVFGFILLVPIWAVGIWWGKLQSNSNSISSVKPTSHKGKGGGSIWIVVIPFMLLGFLLVSGFYLDLSAWPILDFVTNAKGALITVAILSLFSVAPGKRRDCLDSAISRTGSLLLIIGAASALGGVLTKVVPLGNLISPDTGIMGIIGLFVLTAIFKLVQGSSMATFASIGPIAAPIVAASNLSATSAVFAICLGSFFAILPNDSFYWLVRNNALNNSNHIRATIILAGGSTLQALTGFIVLIAFHLIGLV
jgi:GntP family gluconate:H+ symporter